MTTNRAKIGMLCVAMLLPVVTGCAAFRPVKGVPARYVPDEFRGPSRSGKRTIDLKLLQLQLPPNHMHRVDAGDMLSIYVEGILGKIDQPPPVFYPAQNSDIPPSIGFPIPVRDDGTISLPLAGSISVRGFTLAEVEDQIRDAYMVKRQFLKNEAARIFVALQKPRTHRILVIRQEASSDVSVSAQGTLNIGALKRGTGKVVNLPAYKNDVLNALAETGGLPGLDAENALYIIRSNNRGAPLQPQWSPQAAKERSARTVIRAQSPGWGAPSAAVDPHTDYRRAAGSGWSGPNAGTPPAPPQGGFSGPQLNPVPDPIAATPGYPQGAWSQPQAPVVPPQPPMMSAPLQNNWMPPNPTLPPSTWNGATPTGPVLQPELSPTPPAAPYAMPPMLPPQGGYAPTGPVMLPPGGPEIGDHLLGRPIVRIPIRLGPGENADIMPQDVVLYDGDILFIESRDTEIFYTGGLLGGGQYSLPRDYDLDVLGAIAVASGQRAGGAGGSTATASIGGQSALNGDVSISASRIIILRPLPDGTQIPIYVDLYQALKDPSERTVIQPGDYILLQYTPLEAVGAFVERHILAGALFSVASAQLATGGK